MKTQIDPKVRWAMGDLMMISRSKQERERYESRQKMQRDVYTALAEKLDEGASKGAPKNGEPRAIPAAAAASECHVTRTVTGAFAAGVGQPRVATARGTRREIGCWFVNQRSTRAHINRVGRSIGFPANAGIHQCTANVFLGIHSGSSNFAIKNSVAFLYFSDFETPGMTRWHSIPQASAFSFIFTP
jgi:hypothetical protein